jgi:hypothetical protein
MTGRTEISLRRLLGIGALIALSYAESARAEIHTDLQVRYRFDDGSGSTATDSSTTGRNASLNGAVFTSDGRVNGAVQLDGTDDYVDGPIIDETDGVSALTVAFLLNTASRQDYEVVFAKYQGDSAYCGLQLAGSVGHGNDDFLMYINNGFSNNYVYTTGNVLSNNTWIHIAIVYDGNESVDVDECRVYANGVLVPRSVNGTIHETLHSDNTGDWFIGKRQGLSGFALDGKVDEFHVYTRALSESEVQELYLVEVEGSILFNGNLDSPNSKLENTSANLLLAGSDEVTICAWLYPTGQGQTNVGLGGVAFTLDEAASNFFLGHATSGENMTFVAGYTPTSSVTTFAVPHNAWTPVAIAHKYTNGSAPTIRANFQNVTPTQTGSTTPNAAGNGYCIGNFTSQTNTWAGRIAHVQVFNRVLSASEMDGCADGLAVQDLRFPRRRDRGRQHHGRIFADDSHAEGEQQ